MARENRSIGEAGFRRGSASRREKLVSFRSGNGSGEGKSGPDRIQGEVRIIPANFIRSTPCRNLTYDISDRDPCAFDARHAGHDLWIGGNTRMFKHVEILRNPKGRASGTGEEKAGDQEAARCETTPGGGAQEGRAVPARFDSPPRMACSPLEEVRRSKVEGRRSKVEG